MWWMSIIQRAQARIAARRRFLRPPAGGTSNALEDVIGCDEAKTEVGQILDFLKHPKSYTTHGMRVPRGVLLCGPPGTGKTLLARAVAAEAAVPFLYIGGSEFNHKYAGMGVKMVEEVFRVARRLRRCIIFIDEVRSRFSWAILCLW
jgi:ATP-dependent metalloprotease